MRAANFGAPIRTSRGGQFLHHRPRDPTATAARSGHAVVSRHQIPGLRPRGGGGAPFWEWGVGRAGLGLDNPRLVGRPRGGSLGPVEGGVPGHGVAPHFRRRGALVPLRPRARAPRRATPPHFMLGDICRPPLRRFRRSRRPLSTKRRSVGGERAGRTAHTPVAAGPSGIPGRRDVGLRAVFAGPGVRGGPAGPHRAAVWGGHRTHRSSARRRGHDGLVRRRSRASTWPRCLSAGDWVPPGPCVRATINPSGRRPLTQVTAPTPTITLATPSAAIGRAAHPGLIGGRLGPGKTVRVRASHRIDRRLKSAPGAGAGELRTRPAESWRAVQRPPVPWAAGGWLPVPRRDGTLGRAAALPTASAIPPGPGRSIAAGLA